MQAGHDKRPPWLEYMAKLAELQRSTMDALHCTGLTVLFISKLLRRVPTDQHMLLRGLERRDGNIVKLVVR